MFYLNWRLPHNYFIPGSSYVVWYHHLKRAVLNVSWASYAEGCDSAHVTSWTCLKRRKAALSAGTSWSWRVQNPQLDYLRQGRDCWRDKPQLFSILRQFFADITLEWLMSKSLSLTFRYSICIISNSFSCKWCTCNCVFLWEITMPYVILLTKDTFISWGFPCHLQ